LSRDEFGAASDTAAANFSYDLALIVVGCVQPIVNGQGPAGKRESIVQLAGHSAVCLNQKSVIASTTMHATPNPRKTNLLCEPFDRDLGRQLRQC
jgi:hypothetical protein